MCIIPGDRMAQAMRDESQRVDVMAKTLNGIDAFFAPHLARADVQSRKIAEAARLCREADAEEVAERESMGERRACEAERRARAESEDGDVEPWGTAA